MSLISKIKEVVLSLKAGRVTLSYPANPRPVPERFRGRPIFDPEKCIGCAGCANNCPAREILILDPCQEVRIEEIGERGANQRGSATAEIRSQSAACGARRRLGSQVVHGYTGTDFGSGSPLSRYWRQVMMNELVDIRDRFGARLVLEPLPDFLPGARSVNQPQPRVEPIAAGVAFFRRQDLDPVAGAQAVIQRYDATVHFGAAAAMPDVGVNIISKIERRRAVCGCALRRLVCRWTVLSSL